MEPLLTLSIHNKTEFMALEMALMVFKRQGTQVIKECDIDDKQNKEIMKAARAYCSALNKISSYVIKQAEQEGIL